MPVLAAALKAGGEIRQGLVGFQDILLPSHPALRISVGRVVQGGGQGDRAVRVMQPPLPPAPCSSVPEISPINLVPRKH